MGEIVGGDDAGDGGDGGGIVCAVAKVLAGIAETLRQRQQLI